MKNQTTAGVSLIILTWNGLKYTQRCLDTVKSFTNFKNLEIIVLDNGSTDGTVEYLRSLDYIKVITNDINEGFVKGNNKALSAIKDGNDVIFLNNDILIKQPDWVERLQETAYANPKNGIVGCRLIGVRGELQHAGTYIYPETCWGQQIGGNEEDINQFGTVREVQGIIFACAYVKREVLEKIGGLDSDYFSYFEDTDYCLKAKENGYRIMYDGRVTHIHYHNTSTRVNKVNFNEMFTKSQSVFKKKWLEKLKNRYDSKVNWHSIVNFPSGYAVSSKNLMLAMDELNIDVRYKYVYGPGTPWPVMEPGHSDDYRINIIKNRPFDQSTVQVVYGQGDVFNKNSGKYKVGYTMLEVDGLPEDWVRQANSMDEVWVPSHFNVETFINSGVNVPINVIPLGVDPNYFNPFIKSYKPSNKFVFLSVFEWGERKAPEKLLKAFSNEFKKNEDVLLICKVFNNDASIDIRHEINKLDLPNDRSKIVFIYNQNIPGYQMGSLYRSADCLVIPTRGEGWGMPILEGMACGLPVITTDWSAHTEFFNETVGFPIRVNKLVDAEAKCPYYDGFKWADPDLEHLQHQLRFVFENRELAAARGRAAAKEALENWTWHHAAKKIKDRLSEIYE
ncbi:glycosyltransferase [Paenibacillus turpanensis]|uniref:glycosyltransferase n=1 Tax=Paenibacillus turpanensis TaxID=2689078 RepID=UPI001409F2A2|nr:glycosyltransferase [Paenibacillus turpanensis]